MGGPIVRITGYSARVCLKGTKAVTGTVKDQRSCPTARMAGIFSTDVASENRHKKATQEKTRELTI